MKVCILLLFCLMISCSDNSNNSNSNSDNGNSGGTTNTNTTPVSETTHISGTLTISNTSTNVQTSVTSYKVGVVAHTEGSETGQFHTGTVSSTGQYSIDNLPANTAISMYLVDAASGTRVFPVIRPDSAGYTITALGEFEDNLKISGKTTSIALNNGNFTGFATVLDEDTGFALTAAPERSISINSNAVAVVNDPDIDKAMKYFQGNFNISCTEVLSRIDYSIHENDNLFTETLISPTRPGGPLCDSPHFFFNPVKIESPATTQTALGFWFSSSTFQICGSTEGLDNLPVNANITSARHYVTNSNMLAPFQWDAGRLPNFSQLDLTNSNDFTITNALVADVTNWNGYEAHNTNSCVPGYGNVWGSRTKEYCAIMYYLNITGSNENGQPFYFSHCVPDIIWYIPDSGIPRFRLSTVTGSRSKPMGKRAFLSVDKKGTKISAHDRLSFVSNYFVYDSATETADNNMMCNMITDISYTFTLPDITSENMSSNLNGLMSPFEKYFANSSENANVCHQVMRGGNNENSQEAHQGMSLLVKTILQKK